MTDGLRNFEIGIAECGLKTNLNNIRNLQFEI